MFFWLAIRLSQAFINYWKKSWSFFLIHLLLKVMISAIYFCSMLKEKIMEPTLPLQTSSMTPLRTPFGRGSSSVHNFISHKLFRRVAQPSGPSCNLSQQFWNQSKNCFSQLNYKKVRSKLFLTTKTSSNNFTNFRSLKPSRGRKCFKWPSSNKKRTWRPRKPRMRHVWRRHSVFSVSRTEYCSRRWRRISCSRRKIKKHNSKLSKINKSKKKKLLNLRWICKKNKSARKKRQIKKESVSSARLSKSESDRKENKRQKRSVESVKKRRKPKNFKSVWSKKNSWDLSKKREIKISNWKSCPKLRNTANLIISS